jgi:hypothetical protein
MNSRNMYICFVVSNRFLPVHYTELPHENMEDSRIEITEFTTGVPFHYRAKSITITTTDRQQHNSLV